MNISGGTLDLQSFNETVASVSLLSGSITGTGTATLTSLSSYDVRSGTVGVILAGTGALTKTTSGTVTLSGVNTYSGGTTINGGTLIINNAASLGATSGGLTLNAGTLQMATSFASARNITLGDAASTFQIDPALTNTVTGIISGTGSLNKTGTGTMVLSGVNTYTGATTVSAGTLQTSTNERIANTSDLNISGGSFDLQTFSETVRNVTLLSGSIIGTGTGTLTASTYTVQSGTASAILAGTGSTMAKTTAGTVTLTGANTFTGATTVSGGTLTLASASGSALGSTSGITVNSGAILLLGANDQINNTAAMTLFGGTFAKGNFSEGSTSTAGLGTLNLSGAGSHLDFGTGTAGILTFASFNPGGNTLTIDNWTGTAGMSGTDRLIFASDQSANLGSFNFSGFGPGAVEFTLGGGYYEITPIPEPGTYISGLLAFAAILFHHRRQLRGLFPGRNSRVFLQRTARELHHKPALKPPCHVV
jgi:fibronectin-binding autotransporter adhesin